MRPVNEARAGGPGTPMSWHRSAGAGLVLPCSLVAQRRQEALKHLDLGAVEPPSDQAAALLRLGQALLRGAELLTQPGVLLGQPALLGPDGGQLVLQAGHRPRQRGIAARARSVLLGLRFA